MSTTTESREAQYAREVAATIKGQVRWGTWGTLAARNFQATTTKDGAAALRVDITILPFNADGKRSSGARTAWLTIALRADRYDITVQHTRHGDKFGTKGLVTHAETRGVYADQLNNALTAIDWDGPQPFNPRLWS